MHQFARGAVESGCPSGVWHEMWCPTVSMEVISHRADAIVVNGYFCGSPCDTEREEAKLPAWNSLSHMSHICVFVTHTTQMNKDTLFLASSLLWWLGYIFDWSINWFNRSSSRVNHFISLACFTRCSRFPSFAFYSLSSFFLFSPF